MLISPSWPPVMNAVNGLIDCTTSPDKGSLNVGMRGSSFRVSARHGQRDPSRFIVAAVAVACEERMTGCAGSACLRYRHDALCPRSGSAVGFDIDPSRPRAGFADDALAAFADAAGAAAADAGLLDDRGRTVVVHRKAFSEIHSNIPCVARL